MAESKPDKKAGGPKSPPASAPNRLKDLDGKVSEGELSRVKGGAADKFAKIGEIKGESL